MCKAENSQMPQLLLGRTEHILEARPQSQARQNTMETQSSIPVFSWILWATCKTGVFLVSLKWQEPGDQGAGVHQACPARSPAFAHPQTGPKSLGTEQQTQTLGNLRGGFRDLYLPSLLLQIPLGVGGGAGCQVSKEGCPAAGSPAPSLQAGMFHRPGTGWETGQSDPAGARLCRLPSLRVSLHCPLSPSAPSPELACQLTVLGLACSSLSTHIRASSLPPWTPEFSNL